MTDPQTPAPGRPWKRRRFYVHKFQRKYAIVLGISLFAYSGTLDVPGSTSTEMEALQEFLWLKGALCYRHSMSLCVSALAAMPARTRQVRAQRGRFPRRGSSA